MPPRPTWPTPTAGGPAVPSCSSASRAPGPTWRRPLPSAPTTPRAGPGASPPRPPARVSSQDVPGDVKTLEAKVKSEVFGHRDDVDRVVLRADAPGVIAVKGTVPTPVAERELLAEIADVEGVTDVHSELTVSTAG